MSIRFWCARCGRSYLAADEHFGRKVRCKACGYVEPIPDPAPAPPAEDRPALSVAADLVEPIKAPPSIKVEPDFVADRTIAYRPRLLAELLRSGSREASLLQGVALCLVALSAADLFVTYLLLRRGGGFYESNPVAQWFFARWNIAGMALYKFSIIGGVVAIAEFVERRRPGWGRTVLSIGCVAAAAVVIHGLRLLVGAGPIPLD